MVKRLATARAPRAPRGVSRACPRSRRATRRYRASRWTAAVKVAHCSRALDEAVFHGKMRSVEGSERMAMRFTLLERTGVEGFQPRRGSGPREVAQVAARGRGVRLQAGRAQPGEGLASTGCGWTTAGTTSTAPSSRGRASAPPPARTRRRSRTCGCGSRAFATRASADTDRYCAQGDEPGARVRRERAGPPLGGRRRWPATVTAPTLYAGASRRDRIRAPECAELGAGAGGP